MHRKPLLDLLYSYRQRYPQEQRCATRFLAFVQKHPDCFERSLGIGHVTGSAWVVSADSARVLLTHHRKLDIWVQLGGHADGACNIFDVARQEALEESGLPRLQPVSDAIFDIDIHRIPERKNEPAHEHYDVRFAFRADDTATLKVSEESHALAWIEISDIESKTPEPSMLRMAAKWLAQYQQA